MESEPASTSGLSGRFFSLMLGFSTINQEMNPTLGVFVRSLDASVESQGALAHALRRKLSGH